MREGRYRLTTNLTSAGLPLVSASKYIYTKGTKGMAT